jgi:hypothetical protein
MSTPLPPNFKLSSQLMITVIDRVSEGEFLTDVAKDMGLSYSALGSWMDGDPEAREAIAAAKKRGVEALMAKANQVLVDAYENADGKMSGMVQAASNLAHHYRWLAGMLSNQVYGSKVAIEQKSTVTLRDERASLQDKIMEELGATAVEGTKETDDVSRLTH